MSEISTVALITAKEGSADVVEQALRTLAAATHDEEGCLHYSLHRGVQDIFIAWAADGSRASPKRSRRCFRSPRYSCASCT